MIWRCHTSVVAWLYLYMYVCMCVWVFPGGSVVKNPPANAGDARDMGSIPGLGRSPGVGNDNPLQYSCLENSMDRGAWWDTIPAVTKSQTWLSTHTHTHTHTCMCILTFSLFITKNVYVIKHDLYVPDLDLSPWPVPTDTSNWYHLTCPPFWVS